MRLAGIRIHLVIIFLLLALAVLIVGNLLYQKYYLTEPLFKLYQKTRVVEDYRLDDHGKVKRVQVELRKTENLQKSYQELLAGTSQVLGPSRFVLELKDRRNANLEKLFYDSQLVVYEALLKGNFTAMAETIRQKARAAGAEARVFIDRDNIYLQLMQGDNYLYEIIPRNSSQEQPLPDQRGNDGNV